MSILKTRIPRDLQQVFIASNRNELVHTPPKSGNAFKMYRRKIPREVVCPFSDSELNDSISCDSSDGSRRRLLFGRDSMIQFRKQDSARYLLSEPSYDVSPRLPRCRSYDGSPHLPRRVSDKEINSNRWGSTDHSSSDLPPRLPGRCTTTAAA